MMNSEAAVSTPTGAEQSTHHNSQPTQSTITSIATSFQSTIPIVAPLT
jgi:hypothetical protein